MLLSVGQLKQLPRELDRQVEKLLDKLGEEIKIAYEEGKYGIILETHYCADDIGVANLNVKYVNIPMSLVERDRVIKVLRKKGYKVEIIPLDGTHVCKIKWEE